MHFVDVRFKVTVLAYMYEVFTKIFSVLGLHFPIIQNKCIFNVGKLFIMLHFPFGEKKTLIRQHLLNETTIEKTILVFTICEKSNSRTHVIKNPSTIKEIKTISMI